MTTLGSAPAPWATRAAVELERRRRLKGRAPVVDAGPLFRPQPGPQQLLWDSTADIAIIGGSVFGGKTFALTLEPTRHLHVPGFTFAAFRRVTPEIRNPGGMWDEALGMYGFYGGEARSHALEWDFPSGARGKFAGLQYDTSVEDWKGAQICLLMFDQLEEFTANQFWYLSSRNRSTCGVRPYIRGSCNPDPDSWLAGFLSWWIDAETGYAIPERSGVLRWFIRIKDDLVWADTRAELEAKYPDEARHARSVTFILARLQDNPIGNAKDPDYESKVRALPHVDQERLLGGDRGGNWKIRAAAGLVFDRSKFGEVLPAALTNGRIAKRLRAWDKAATPGAGDWTAGVKMALGIDGVIYVEDVVRGQWSTGDRHVVESQVAGLDTPAVLIRMEQEPGASGKDAAVSAAQRLAGYDIASVPSTGDKLVRAGPFAAQVKAGNVRLVAGPWNEPFLRELHAFPTKGVPDDQVDAAALAFNQLTLHPEPTVTAVKFRW